MKQLTWLHLSDWHQKGPDFDRRVVRDALIKDIRERERIDPSLARVDFVVFSGDLAFSGKSAEYKAARQHLLDRLLDATGLEHSRLFIVPGNHDLDRDILYGMLPTELQKPLDSNALVKKWLLDTQRRAKTLEPFKAYRRFVSKYTRQPTPDYASIVRFDAGGKRIALLGLNSAWMTARNKDAQGEVSDYGYTLIGEPQVYDALAQIRDAELRIAVVHHPFDWLKEFDRNCTEGQLSHECHFILRGHVHIPQVYKIGGTVGDCVIIPAGASYDRRVPQDPLYTNAYNWVHLDFEARRGAIYLRRWSDRRKEWIEDIETHPGGKFVLDNLPKELGKQTDIPRIATRLGLSLSPVTKGNMQTDFDNDLLAYFTDVEHLRGVFKEYVTAKTLPKRLLVIHGVGGVGKSSLLRMFRLHCKGAHVPVALASGDEAKSAPDVLARWTDALKADGVAFPAFGKTFEHYRAIQAKVDEQAKKAQGALGGRLGGMGGEALVDWLRGFLNQPDIDLLLDPTKKLIDDFLGDVALAADKRRMVLMLDTFEQMAALDHWARDVAQRLHTNTLFVIGGRALPNWSRAWQSWMAHAQVEELKPMTEDDMRELVRRYYATMRGGEPNPAQVEAIIRFARGLPIVVTSVVRLWVKYPDRVGDLKAVTPEVMADLVDRLIEGVPKEFIPTLEAAAVVRWFDQPILRAVTGLADVRDVYNELRRSPFVRTRAEGLALHDAVRELMDENLRVQDSERHCELHERAAAYFEKRLEKTTGEEAERLGLERLYHRVRAGEEAGIRLFQEMAEELVRYRLVNRSHALLNDVNTYPLERENSRLWREYYNARLAHLVELIDEAEEKFQVIIENQYVDPKLKAYALCDYGAIARRIERQSLEKAVHILEQIPALGVAVDSKLVFYLLELSGAYRRQGRSDDSLSCLTKARDYFAQTGDYYGLAYTYNRTKYHYLNQGIWKEGFEMQRRGLETLSKVSEQSFLRAEFLSGLSVGWVWAGLFREAEGNLKEAAAISDKLNTTSLYSFRDLGLVLGLRGKLSEATYYFERSISIAQSHNDFVSIAFAKGFQGFVALKWAELAVAEHYLNESIAAFRKWPDKSEMPLLLNWWGMLNEAKHNYQFAQNGFEECIGLKKIGRIYWHAGALTGLVRVKHAQGDYVAIAPLLAEAEQLAQQYEYNDHLASLRLTQAMLAWEGITTDKTGINGQTSASPSPVQSNQSVVIGFFKQAMIYALRYNRFLLDEVLSGRPQGTPLRPIIRYCLAHGEEGRRMLIALRDWWQAGGNDIGTLRPDTISPIPEGIALLEAEGIAREREPGDGSPQRSAVEQIEAALRKREAG